MKEKNIFRLAAIIYGGNENELNIKPDTTVRKIIESIFILNDNRELDIYVLAQMIHDHYHLSFLEERIAKIVENNKSKYFKIDENMNVNLIVSRFERLKKRFDSESIENIIAVFSKDYISKNEEINSEYTEERIQKLIYSFLYDMFLSNLKLFKSISESRESIDEIIKNSIKNGKKNDQEKRIINSFFDYDNLEKDKAVFHIASMAMEYCLLVGNNKKILSESFLNGKTLFLDTNIIFRALGLNGKERRIKTENFLEKCRELNIVLKITSFSYFEFTETIKYKTDSLREMRISPNVLLHFSDDGFTKFYLSWISEKKGRNNNRFRSYITSQLNALMEKYGVRLEDNISDKLKSEKIYKDKIEQYKESMLSVKKSTKSNNVAENDAKNIVYIRDKRGYFKSHHIITRTLADTNYFLISTDSGLKKWATEYFEDDFVPIILRPSDWLVFLLRYVSRTDDDYRSFISFLKLNFSNEVIDDQSMLSIIDGIADITDDLEKQEFIIEEFLNNEYKEIESLSEKADYEALKEESKAYATKILDSENESLREEIKEISERKENEIKCLEKKKEERIIALEEENEKLKEKMIKDKAKAYASGKIKKNKIIIYGLCITISLVLMMIPFLMICFIQCDWNFVSKLYKKASTFFLTNKPEINGSVLFWIFITIPTALILYILKNYKRLLERYCGDEYENELMKEFMNV